MSEKLHKVLAQAGLGSRRVMEQWISAGRVSVDGHVAKLGDRVSDSAHICVDGKPIKTYGKPEKCRILLYHKPPGEICTRNDPEGRSTVFEHLPPLKIGRWIAVGRLDINSSGLLLFTNCGELANQLMHPSSMLEREYAVRVFGDVNNAMLSRLQKGVELGDGRAQFGEIRDAGGEGKNHWFYVVVKEGRNRLVRRLWESQGVKVSRLIRIRYGSLVLPRSLADGRWLALKEAEIHTLKKSLVRS